MRVFLIAGEPSGDRLGGALMEGLRSLVPDVHFEGVGGAQMQAQGLNSRFPMEELSVMGIAEVLPKYMHLKRRISETVRAVIEARPDVLITIDSPDFCLRVASQVKAAAPIRTVHYVAPTVWAWRPGRARKMAQMIDQVLALFPFEPPYMEAAGMQCDFVGHPVVGEPQATPEEVAAFRSVFDLGDERFVLVLPGSRHGEVSRLTPVFGRALSRLAQTHPDLRIVVPAAAPVADLVRERVADWPVGTVVIDPREFAAQDAQAHKRAAFRAADVALAASGTVSLELAAAQTAMVVAYTFNWLSWQIISRMALIDTVTLVNLVSDTRVVPECLGPDCQPDQIATALDDVLTDPTAQAQAMEVTMHRLGRGEASPGLRAARAVVDRL
ncbi:lipid-A-disaccharide synthase [Sedimentitalea todarodis]|uniref:Lipid-A-disaccharide synthase n=1 Tax=Sedimentitalea todarodis TaxID=1631240 RepID=A0ABU3VB13_9RHOB|nr:lipid-A-disaccharide synthase [Sedimentitalea todarodis]MDU9003346.1 lipid-A-disaccharide synthase [Sedimentitalea todarodis]